MNLHLLRLFVTTAEHRSFSRAAEALHISQPAVSKGVKELEAQIGAQLFERVGRDLGLTEAGRVLLRNGRGLFAAEKIAEEELAALRGMQSGTLRIGASTTVAGYFLAPALSVFCEQRPKVGVRVIIGNTSEIVDRLIERDLDLAIIEGSSNNAETQALPWLEDEMAIVVAPSHRLAKVKTIKPADFTAVTFIVREPGSGTREVALKALSAAGIAPRKMMEIGGTEAIANVVAAGFGFGIVSRATVATHLALGVLRGLEVEGLRISRMLTRLYIPGRVLSPAANAFDRILDSARSKAG